MSWSRRWRIASKARLHSVLGSLTHTLVSDAAPLELILRTERKEKNHEQRKLFHAVCADLAPLLGLTPGGTKLKIKASFYGVEIVNEDGVYYALVPSSEESDKDEYSRLIDHAYLFGAEAGFNIPDRRPK